MTLREFAPWDMIPYLAPPAWASPAIASAKATKVLSADPRRVLVAFSSSATVAVGTDNTVNAGLSALLGWQITSGQFPIILPFWDYGPIVCGEWWVFCQQSTGQFSVMTQALVNVWPDSPGGHLAELLERSARPNMDVPLDRTPIKGGTWNPMTYWRQLMAALRGR